MAVDASPNKAREIEKLAVDRMRAMGYNETNISNLLLGSLSVFPDAIAAADARAAADMPLHPPIAAEDRAELEAAMQTQYVNGVPKQTAASQSLIDLDNDAKGLRGASAEAPALDTFESSRSLRMPRRSRP